MNSTQSVFLRLRVGALLIVFDSCLVFTSVQPRANTWIFYYLFYRLAPRPVIKLVVQSPGEPPRPLEVKAKVQMNKRTVDLTDTIDLNKYDREQEGRRSDERSPFQFLRRRLDNLEDAAIQPYQVARKKPCFV